MAQKTTLKQMLEDASAEIKRVSTEDAIALHQNEDVIWVDIRDIRELWRDGMIPNAIHAPRGMLEWWVDAESPYHREVFASDKQFVLY